MKTEYYSVFRNHRIPNIKYYLVLRKSKYRILFGIEKIQIPNTNSTIQSNYLNTVWEPTDCVWMGHAHNTNLPLTKPVSWQASMDKHEQNIIMLYYRRLSASPPPCSGQGMTCKTGLQAAWRCTQIGMFS